MDTVKISESIIPWIEDEFINQSTSVPEILEEEETPIATVIIFVISAVITITLLFVIAIFIDCRQQKLIDLEKQRISRRILRIKMPTIIGRSVRREDEQTIVDKMSDPEPCSSSSVIV